MAYEIHEHCTGCGICLSVCPNYAITEGAPVYKINHWFCTECVGYSDKPQCAEVCPDDAIGPSRERVPLLLPNPI